jgi:hypothetical protein
MAKTAALAQLLSETIDGDRYPLSPRILTLKAIPREDPPRAGAQAPPAAAALRAASSDGSKETAPRVKSEPGPDDAREPPLLAFA